MNIKFPVPVLGEDAHMLYSKLYGAAGEKLLDVLDMSPNEIAVISRLIAYLKDRREIE